MKLTMINTIIDPTFVTLFDVMGQEVYRELDLLLYYKKMATFEILQSTSYQYQANWWKHNQASGKDSRDKKYRIE